MLKGCWSLSLQSNLEDKIKRTISIPEYYIRYINSAVNLLENPKQCCPFHHEDTPSFSFSVDRGVWRCFGACHTGGDVIDLARMHRKLASREEAVSYLCSLLHIQPDAITKLTPRTESVDEAKSQLNRLIQDIERICKGPDDWIDFDVAMSYNEVTMDKLQRLKKLARDKEWDIGGI